MATTKAFAAIWNAQSLTAGATDVESGVQTIDTGYGATVHMKITNGTTAPVVPAQVRIQVSGDNSEFYFFGGPMVADSVANSVTEIGGIEIPMGVEFLKLRAGSNTVDAVTIDADISNVTGV